MPTINIADPSVYTNNAGKFTDGAKVLADLATVFDEVNLKETRLVNIESQAMTIAGDKTFSGVTTITGTLNIPLVASPGSPVEGMIWENSTGHTLNWYDGSAVRTLVNQGDVDLLLPSQTGANLKVITSNGTTSAWALPIFSQQFLSAAQTITSAGALTLAHSLGAVPKVVNLFVKCVTAEAGYSIGDEVLVGPDHYSTQDITSRGFSVVSDATNINIRIGSDGVNVINKSSGIGTAITNANWSLLVRAYA